MSSLAGTRALLRLALRRDRVVLPVFLVIVVGMVASSASATIALYPDAASRIEASTVINTATSTLAMFGPIHDPTSIGALSVFKIGMMSVLALAVFAARMVVRHTRAEEETGRLELLGAAVVGRRAPLTAALIVAVGASLTAGLFSGLGLFGTGLAGGGSAIMGAAIAGMGVVGAAFGAVAAQLTTSARGAAGMATGAIAVFYGIRAVADSASDGALSWLSWLSPVGWYQQARPYAGDRAWPLALLAALAIVLVAVGYALATRRDFAGSLLADRAGGATAPRYLGSPLGLAWRLQRNAFWIWAGTFALVGAMVGGLTGSVGSFIDSASMRDIIDKLGGAAFLEDAFLSVEISFMAIAVTIFGLQAVLRSRAEEVGLRAEPMLASATTRLRWLGSFLVVSLAGSVALLLIVGTTAGLASAGAVDYSNQVARVVGAALVQIPAIFVVIGIGVAGFGIAGRLGFAGWAALTVFVLLGEFGKLLNIPQGILNLAPYSHTPRLPGVELSWSPIIWMSAIAIALFVIGFAAFRRRDIS